MKIVPIMLVATAIVTAGVIAWWCVAARRYVDLDNLEFKDGEITEVNLSDLDPRDPMTAFFKETAQTQAAGLDGASVTIHSVTEYDHFRDATPQPGEKLVAVDVAFSHFKYGFDLDDVELLDVERAEVESCGSDAYQVYLNADGTLHPKQGQDYWTANHDRDSVRLYLVYSVAKSVQKTGLGYWGRVIVDRRYDVQLPRQPPPQPNKQAL